MFQINILIFFILFFQTYSVIPIWDFNAQSIDLLSSQESNYNYTTYNSVNIRLEKIFIRNNGIITYKNQLTIGDVTKEVPFDYIGSYYLNLLGHDILICPKGKFHPYDFYNNQSIIPSDFEENGDWELKCYKHETGYFLIFYLMNGGQKIFYRVNINNEDEIRIINERFMYQNLYDFKLENGISENVYEYKFPIIIQDGEYMKLISDFLSLNSEFFEQMVHIKRDLIQTKLKTQAYIDDYSYLFYFFTYDDINSFSSGYSVRNLDMSSEENFDSSIENLMLYVNNYSPFAFIDSMDILDIKFTYYYSHALYKILNKNNNKINYGIFDVKTNKILLNLEEDIVSIFSYPHGDILAITQSSVYKICIIKYGNSCSSSYTQDGLLEEGLLLDTNGNKIQNECDSGKIKLMPEGICIEKQQCDLNFLTLNNEETECGLCSYFYPEGTKYKFIYTTGCIDDAIIPDNSEYFNEELYLIKCKLNFHIYNNECIPDYCYETCETCYDIFNNTNDQKCLTCKSGYYLKDGNCLIKKEKTEIIQMTNIICSNGYFLSENNACQICENSCQNYDINNCNCTSCQNGYFYIQ